MFGSKDDFDSLEAAVADALDESTDNNIAHIVYEGVTIQYLNDDDPVCNVVGYDGEIGHKSFRSCISEPIIEDEDGVYILVASSHSQSAVVEQIEEIASVVGCTRADLNRTAGYQTLTEPVGKVIKEKIRALSPF